MKLNLKDVKSFTGQSSIFKIAKTSVLFAQLLLILLASKPSLNYIDFNLLTISRVIRRQTLSFYVRLVTKEQVAYKTD